MPSQLSEPRFDFSGPSAIETCGPHVTLTPEEETLWKIVQTDMEKIGAQLHARDAVEKRATNAREISLIHIGNSKARAKRRIADAQADLEMFSELERMWKTGGEDDAAALELGKGLWKVWNDIVETMRYKIAGAARGGGRQ